MVKHSSQIFWHFTGSPKDIQWAKITKPADIVKNNSIKSTQESLKVLSAIIKSKKLKATCTEGLYGRQITDKFCCVTDLPSHSLAPHKQYYGDVAIGFNSKHIYQSFNPVLYIPKDKNISPGFSFTNGFEKIGMVDLESWGIDEGTANRSGFTKDKDGEYIVPTATVSYKDRTELERYLLNYVKLSGFSDQPGESFYQEKEWRRIGDFKFEFNDIAAIILPKDASAQLFELLPNLNDIGITILSWEVLEKMS